MSVLPLDWRPMLHVHPGWCALALGLGGAVWAWSSRRRPWTPLSLLQRVTLLLLLAATPVVWWQTGRRLTREDVPAPSAAPKDAWKPEFLPVVPVPLADRIVHAMDIDLPRGIALASSDSARVLAGKNVLMLLPPAQVEWSVDASVRAVDVAYGVHPEAYGVGRTDGVDLYLEQVDERVTRRIFQRHVDPQHQSGDRGEFHETIVLPPSSRPSKLVLHTGSGPADDASWDWLFLARFRLRRSSGFFHRQFPGFNRLPEKIDVGYTGIATDEDGKDYLFVNTPSRLEFPLLAQDRRVEVTYGFAPSAYSNGGRSNGAILRLELIPATGVPVRLYDYYARPLENPADRGLLRAVVAVPGHVPGDRLVLQLLPGEYDDASWDHTFIRELTFK